MDPGGATATPARPASGDTGPTAALLDSRSWPPLAVGARSLCPGPTATWSQRATPPRSRDRIFSSGVAAGSQTNRNFGLDNFLCGLYAAFGSTVVVFARILRPLSSRADMTSGGIRVVKKGKIHSL